MKRRCCLVLIVLLALSYVSSAPVVGACSSRASGPQETRGKIDGWARENYELALDQVLPDHCEAGKDVRWIVCIRIVPGYPSDLEYSLSVEKRYGGTIFAHITRPKSQSVYMQLCKEKKKHPGASVGDLTKLIELESQTGDQGRFPGLAGLADEFEKVRFSPVLSDEITMDATQYNLCVKSISGEQMRLTLYGPGSTAAHQPETMIQWTESARSMLGSAFK